jgi:hypothetical protein
MRTLANESTADQLLDYLASDGRGAEWTRYAELADWESLYNLLGERGFIGRLAQDLAGRGQAEARRAAAGMQLRLTPAGIARADQRAEALDGMLADRGPHLSPQVLARPPGPNARSTRYISSST